MKHIIRPMLFNMFFVGISTGVCICAIANKFYGAAALNAFVALINVFAVRGRLVELREYEELTTVAKAEAQ